VTSIFDKITSYSTIGGRKIEGGTSDEPLYTDRSRVLVPGGETTTTPVGGEIRGAKISDEGGVGRGSPANLDPRLTIY
jgi:hypothetical protein